MYFKSDKVMDMKYKRILVTGAAGLLGRAVIPNLQKKGYEVIAIDITKPEIKNIESIQTDFGNATIMKYILPTVDAVFHFAAMLGVDNCRLHPDQVLKVNYEDTKKLIDMCVKHNVKKFIFTSSSEVYGNSKEIPYREDGKLAPVSIYGKAKVMIEKYLKKTQKKTGLKVGIVRLFNVYGFNQRPSFVVPRFIDFALNNKPITIYGDGKQVRCYTYVNDGAEGIVQLFEYNKTPYEIVNIGRNHEYTVAELAEIILKNLPKSKSKIQYLEYGKGDVREESLEIRRRVPSVEKAKKLFGFEAQMSLEKGIGNIVTEWEKYFVKWKKISNKPI